MQTRPYLETDEPLLRQSLRNEGSAERATLKADTIWVAEDERGTLGFWSFISGPNVIIIDIFIVLPEYRHTPTSSEVGKACVSKVKELGYDRLMVQGQEAYVLRWICKVFGVDPVMNNDKMWVVHIPVEDEQKTVPTKRRAPSKKKPA